ncbi:hypothetical protein CRENBAI_016138 [Crenichthys baileyi]|uniref:Uncharacterized protein n=1 Tax=Crenichthys baileyi TaxID=28760 RepID=A0AAV9R0R3_9TELE
MPGTRPQPQPGKQGNKKTSHSNTEAATKPRPIPKTAAPPKKQAPGQDRERHRPSKPKGAHSARSKEATPPSRDADPTNIQGQAKTADPSTQTPGNIPQMATPPQYEAQKPDASAETSDAPLPHPRPEVRAPTHRTTAPKPQHAIQRRTECSKEHPEQKLHTKLTLRKCTPTSPPKNKNPPVKRTPTKENPQDPGPRTCPDTPTPARSSPARRPTRGPKKRQREPTEPKPKPIRKPRPVHPKTTRPARPLT